MKKILLAAAAATLGLSSLSARATDVTGDFHVIMNVAAACSLAGGAGGLTIGAPIGTLDFGTYSGSLGNGAASGASTTFTSIGVACTLGTTYLLKLNQGTNGAGTVTTRKMLRDGVALGDATATDLAAYKLYCGATSVVTSATANTGVAAGNGATTCATNWGNTAGTAVSGLGTNVAGLPVSVATPHPVNGYVAPGLSLSAGTYDDIVTATLTY